MQLKNIAEYRRDVEAAASLDTKWEKLKNASVIICGASGMIGSFLIDVLMLKNSRDSLGCKIYAVGRNEARLRERFEQSELLHILPCDITQPIEWDFPADFVIHAASNTHPQAYSADPVGTITTNVIGTNRLLEYAAKRLKKRFVFVSSVEVYGENRGDVERFCEDYCGYIDCNTLRAGYPEGKRTGEALCQAYAKQYGVDVVIPRLSRVYGPTMLMSDSKASSQFIKKGLQGENIVLKSAGTQLYSYIYVVDAVAGLLKCMLEGDSGEAYNISGPDSDVRLKDLAEMIAEKAGTKVVFELPDQAEAAGYSKATVAVLDSSKLTALSWQPEYTMKVGIEQTMKILRQTL